KKALKPRGSQGFAVRVLQTSAAGRTPGIPRSGRIKPKGKGKASRPVAQADERSIRGVCLIRHAGAAAGANKGKRFGGKKGNPGEIRTGVPYKIAAAPDGQPVGCLSAAAPGYHYTRDHLLSLDLPAAAGNQHDRPRALARHATVA